MCSGPDSSKRRLTPPGFSMEPDLQKAAADPCRCAAELLEFSASDDLAAFKRAVEEADAAAALDEAAVWYGRLIGTRRMGHERRTPLMIAALYGSLEILKYILSKGGVDVNRACGSDGATALHCAAAGGAATAAEIVRLLVAASASVDSVDAAGNQAGDVIPKPPSPALKQKKKVLEMMLKKVGDETEDGESSPEEQAAQSLPSDLVSSEGKKEYPIDLSLPDIKNGIYGTDEFRMFTFKVKPCSRAYSHDWTECPFVHPGENARRRDPRKYHYSCVPCPEFRKGTCRNADNCEYAHGVFECWLHPAQYRTRLCKDETGCSRRVCFFAHKPEELRPLHPSTGSAMLSPRSSSSSSSLDMLSPLAQLGSQSGLMMPTSTPPMSPISSPGIGGGGGMWQNQAIPPPALQLPSSRLKSAFNARDLQMDMDLVGMEMDELANFSALAALAGSRSGRFNHVGSTAASNYDDLLASLDQSSLSQLQGLSMKSPHMRQNLQQGFSSPMRTASSGIDPSLSVAAAVMNSRSAAFAKRSQSFSERALMNRYSGGLNTAATTMATTSPIGSSTASMLSDWGSPNGKLDWGVQGDELNKLRKSASFGIRSNGGGSMGGMGAAAMGGSVVDEPDVSWVQSLVKDGPPSAGWPGSEQQQQQYQRNSGGAGDFHPSEMLSPWAEQLYMEQEQMVA